MAPCRLRRSKTPTFEATEPPEEQMAKKAAASRSKVKDLKVQKKSAVKVKAGLARTNKRLDS